MKVLKPDPVVSVNKKGGSTISIVKRGGWDESFQLACRIAGWTPKLAVW